MDEEIVSIESIGETEMLDIEVDGNHLFYANGILTHNSSHEVEEYTHASIAGGISKIQSCDLCLAIRVNLTLRERGAYEFQFLKTRTSAGVGHKIELAFDQITMRMTDPEPEDITKARDPSSIAKDLRERVSAPDPGGDIRAAMKDVWRRGNTF